LSGPACAIGTVLLHIAPFPMPRNRGSVGWPSGTRQDVARQACEQGPITAAEAPDDRYLIVRGQLWRTSNPHLTAKEREALVARFMDARRAVAAAERGKDADAENVAHEAVGAAKAALLLRERFEQAESPAVRPRAP
jgi:hypothetical protein